MTSTPFRDRVAAILGRFDDVAARPEFGTQSYWIAKTRFASLTDRAVVVHLPPTELIEAMRQGVARPFVSAGAMARNGWVEVSAAIAPEFLERLLEAAVGAARHAHRRATPRKPTGARRTRRAPARP